MLDGGKMGQEGSVHTAAPFRHHRPTPLVVLSIETASGGGHRRRQVRPGSVNRAMLANTRTKSPVIMQTDHQCSRAKSWRERQSACRFGRKQEVV